MGDNGLLRPGESTKPVLEHKDVESLVLEHYGVKVISVVELNGYDDKNYQVRGENAENDGYVFKVVNTFDSRKPEFFEAQSLLMMYLGNHGIKCSKPVSTKEGYYCKKVTLKSGEHIIRLLEFIPGIILHKVTSTPDMFYQVGETVAKLDLALKDFHHPAFEGHKTLWMLDSIPDLKEFFFVVKNKERRAMCEEIIEEFQNRVPAILNPLQRRIIHGDFNEQNILVEKENTKYKVKAVLDFGDSHLGFYLYELAITMAYMIVEANDLKAGGYVLGGYTSVMELPDKELILLKTCIAARLSQSLIMGAYTFSLEPNNLYLLTTSVNGWNLLEKLWSETDVDLLNEWKRLAGEFRQDQSSHH